MKKLTLALAALAVTALLAVDRASAQNLLSNGDFEDSADFIEGWTLEEIRVGDPSGVVNAAQPVGFANNPGGTDGEFGLWLRSFVGNPDDGLADAILSQTVAATPGEEYTFSGEASFEGNYAGGVAFLDLLSPFGEIPSPTETTFRLEFLDAGGSVLSEASKNVAEDVFNGFGYTAVTPVTATAPAGTVSARVVAEATSMAFNIDPGQTAFFDNFSLTGQSSPSTELLVNGNLNVADSSNQNFIDWDVEESPEGNDTLQLQGFANDPATGGATGAWVRAFLEGGSVLSQTVPAAPGSEYTFQASSLWEENYSGGQVDTPTSTTLELAFLDEGDAVIGTPVTLDLRTEQTNGAGWATHTLSGTAPEGTINVRVAGITADMINTEGGQSAFWDDFVLTVGGGEPAAGDFNGDGTVDNGDLNLLLGNWGEATVPAEWVNGFDTPVDNGELNALLGNWGFGTGTAVPEPASLLLIGLTCSALAARRR